MKTIEKARFDTRLPKKQKELFEYAARLGGFRTLTDFVVVAVNEKANLIIKEHNTILSSEKDRSVFFKEISDPHKPNKSLKAAAEAFRVAAVR
jgi:uncharacterized protein (DUF1778 family)